MVHKFFVTILCSLTRRRQGKPRATKHDILLSYRAAIKKSPLFFNAGLTPDEAESLIASKQIDAAIFGWLFIGHPDLPKRIEKGIALDAKVDFASQASIGPQSTLEELRKGYADYPFAT